MKLLELQDSNRLIGTPVHLIDSHQTTVSSIVRDTKQPLHESLHFLLTISIKYRKARKRTTLYNMKARMLTNNPVQHKGKNANYPVQHEGKNASYPAHREGKNANYPVQQEGKNANYPVQQEGKNTPEIHHKITVIQHRRIN